MKYRLISFVVTLIAVVITGTYIAHAEEQPDNVLTDEQRSVIVANCTNIQATLNRIHQNDALARYNRGHLYRAIIDRLMSPLNQRIASNQLDGSELVQTRARYNTQYQGLFTTYREYELALRDAMDIDCTKQPVDFYDAVTNARKKRLLVRDASVKLLDLAEQYKNHFNNFRSIRQEANL